MSNDYATAVECIKNGCQTNIYLKSVKVNFFHMTDKRTI